MIHIMLNSDQISRIKEKWALWFFKIQRVRNFVEILEKDTDFRSFFFDQDEDFQEWKISYQKCPKIIKNKEWQAPVTEYFFENLSDRDSVARKYSKEIKSSTKEFLIAAYNSYRRANTLMQILDEIGIQVCPYCNRNFLDRYALRDKHGKKLFYYKGDLDHYYSKKEMPALILSFYNLIPCCKVCNHEKHESNLRTFHPYYDFEDQEYCFAIELYSDKEEDISYNKLFGLEKYQSYDSTVWQGVSDNFKIIFKSAQTGELNELVGNSNTIFRLEKKYNHSKEYVKELIRKKYIYPQVKKRELLENFPQIFKTEPDLEETFFSISSMTPSKPYDKPLAKLAKDILKQLDM